MNKFLVSFIVALLFLPTPADAAVIARQTDQYSNSLNVWQMIQELGNNLSGPLGTFTFRVHTNLTNLQQFDFTVFNTKIYDKTTNTQVAAGCLPQSDNPADPLRGLIFNTEGVPAGFKDVTIDFSCNNFSFIPGHRYLIRISNANQAAYGGKRILLASAAYGASGQDFFPGGGLRYAFDNAGCYPLSYIWNSPVASAGCNIWTSSRDDLYFILSDNTPEPTPTPTPIPTPTPSPTPTPKTPLILIPGIGGSELKVNEDTIWSQDDGHGGTFSHIYPKDEKVWVNEGEAINPGDDDYFDVLRMKEDGVSSEANLGLTGNLYAGAYQGVINFFTSNEVGYTLNQNFFVFPYDWRLDLSGTATLLDTKIQQIKQQTRAQKVDIITHSMGGLVARNYIADSIRAQNVRKLFTLGTPHLGSPHFLKVLRYGDCLTRLPLLQQPICIGLTYSEVKDVIRNMISGFQLAPSQAYFNIYNSQDNLHPFPYADIRDIDNNGVTGPLNYAQTKTLLTNLGHNTGLFIPSETFHNLDNNLTDTNNVDVTNIVGSGMATLGQIIEKYKIDFAGVKIPQKEEIKINGDDTVPLLSAAFGATKVFYAKQKHGELPNPGPAMNLVKNILDDNNQIPVGISHDPYPFKGTQVSVHSPVNIHVYDLNGNHTGPLPNGDFEVNIPGSSYDTLDNAKFIFLPDDGVYTINFEATGQGNFDFKIRKYEDDISSESILYKDIPITSTSIGQTILDTSSLQPPTLQIDQQTITPTATIAGNENFDRTLPQLSLDATPKLIWPPNNKMVDVNIIGSSFDENLYRTIFIVEDEYGLVEPTITQFNQIIKLQAFRREDDQDGRIYTIRAIAEDLAGNTTESQVEIVIPHDQRDKN